jgi:hypothetical protein
VCDTRVNCLDVLVSGAIRALGYSNELFVLGGSVILTALGQLRSKFCAVGKHHLDSVSTSALIL